MLYEDTNAPYSADLFRHKFAEVRARVAEKWPAFDPDWKDPDAEPIPTAALEFRFLRHTAVTKMTEAGVDALAIAKVTGHKPTTIPQIAEHYQIDALSVTAGALEKRAAFEAAADAAGDASIDTKKPESSKV
ncbi:MAG: hypothetical protein RIB45_10620 [Marivibrio sp.]|uniref:hypothetical protein n=1 Tax=Marivibrio sp. TaxID=2039719 RepID=UPI0032F02AE0